MDRKNNKHNVWLARMLVCASFFVCMAGSAACYAQEKIVAVVNNEIITEKDLNDFLAFMRVQLSKDNKPALVEKKLGSIKSDLLNRLIEDRLILQEAKKNNVRIDEERVKRQLEEIKKRYPSALEFQNALSQQGMTIADIEERIRDQLLMYAIIETRVKRKIVVNPAEVTEYYNKNIAGFSSPEQREFESVIVESEKNAQEVALKIKGGESAMDLAITYPLKVNKLTLKAQEELRKDIEEAVFGLNVGEAAGPFKVGESFYIFKLTSITPPKEQPFQEVQDQLYRFIFDKKMQESLVSWLEDVKKHSYIKVIEG
jgi:parvulin-like peptidyl-prolyl isomerase